MIALTSFLALGFANFKPTDSDNPNTSDAASFIASYEGFSPIFYKCAAGVKTIGWGTTCTDCKEPITKQQGYELLVEYIQKQIMPLIPDDLTDNQKIALSSFIYNIGSAKYRSSTLAKYINSKQYDKAALEFLKWNKYTNPKTGKLEVLSGLTKRRLAEKKLWETK